MILKHLLGVDKMTNRSRTSGTPEKKSDAVRRLVAAGEYKAALRIAKGFRLGITKQQSDDMIRGFECLTNPRFYQSLGFDTTALVHKGVETLKQIYG